MNDSYIIEVTYAHNVEEPGEVRFSYDDRERIFSVIWRGTSGIGSRPQKVYFSCRVNFLPKRQTLEDALIDFMKLIFFGMHWKSDQSAFYTFDAYSFCGEWFCAESLDPSSCYWLCSTVLFLFDISEKISLAKGWGTDWDRSPLLNLTPLHDKWQNDKSPEYFDNVKLVNTGTQNIQIARINVVLNNIAIFYRDYGSNPLVLEPGLSNAEDFTDDIWYYRLETDLGVPASIRTRILKEAGKNLGQAWDYRYAGDWEHDDDIWQPRPVVWCSEFACQMINKYTTLAGEVNEGDCGNIYVGDIWDYFQNCCEVRVISPEYGCSWDSLNDSQNLRCFLRPGYYVGMSAPAEQTKDDEGLGKIWHSTFFVEWVAGWQPRMDDQDGDIERGECSARFRGIGGNQGGGKITVATFDLYNLGCGWHPPPDDPDNIEDIRWPEMIWGDEWNDEPATEDARWYNFFATLTTADDPKEK